MENLNLAFICLVIIVLTVFLIHFISKRISTVLANGDEQILSVGKNLVYYACKWLGILFLIALCFNLIWIGPPHWIERRQQRKIVIARVEAAGGWAAIKADCESMVREHGTNLSYHWIRGDKGAPPLPKSLAAIEPRFIEFSPEVNGKLSVSIRIFGMHSTGGRGQGFYALKVVCARPPNAPFVGLTNPGAKVNYGGRKIVDEVYEVSSKY